MNRDGTAYYTGEWFGTGHSLLMLPAGPGVNAVAQMGQRGTLIQRVSRGVGRLFWDGRQWPSVSGMWTQWYGFNRRFGPHLHHVIFPQRLGPWGMPPGIINAGLNYMPMTPWINSYMNGLTWTSLGVQFVYTGGYLTQLSAIVNPIISLF